MCLPLAEMLNIFVKDIRITAFAELHLLSWFWRWSVNHNGSMSCGRFSIGIHVWYFAKEVSTKFTNVCEQFAMAHELFMNLYLLCIGINRYKQSFWVLCTALWGSLRSVWAALWALKFANYYIWAASFPWLIFCFLLQLSSSSAIQLPSKETDKNTLY